MIWENASRRLRAASLMIKHASVKSISNSDKSSYYRAASYLLCTVIEGMTYEVAKITSAPTHIINTKTEYKEKHKIKKGVLGVPNDLFIFEKVSKNIHINDDGVNFGSFNIYLKNKKIISEPEFKLLDSIRIQRNKIHIQGLSKADTGFTFKNILKLSKGVKLLIDKLDALLRP